MDQKKTGQFLKTLRKEKNITQEVLAEKLNVSGRTVSRWETGSNMPDISLLVELSEFYQVSIAEIIDGERKHVKGEENFYDSQDQLERKSDISPGKNEKEAFFRQEVKTTAMKMAEYSKNELGTEKRKIISLFFMMFGVFVMVSAFAIFPNESSWGSIYAIIGGIILTAGIDFKMKSVLVKRSSRLLWVAGCLMILFGIFTVSDYVAVSQFQQVPRFRYETSYGEDVVEHKTLFYTVIQKNPGTAEERIEIVR